MNYEPQGNLNLVFSNKEKQVAVVGPRGTGKTLSVLQLAWTRARTYPNSRQLFIKSTRRELVSSVMEPFVQEVCTQEDVESFGTANSFNRDSYRFANGSQIFLGGCDYIDRWHSTNIDCCYIFEATNGIKETDYDKLVLITRDNKMGFRQVVSDMNPTYPQHFYKKRIDEGRIYEIRSTHKDNPTWYNWSKKTFTPLGVENIANLEGLPPIQRARWLIGDWVGMDGLVYPEFNSDCIIDDMEIPREWKRIRCCDFGFTHPFVCLWLAIDPNDTIYIYRQWYHTNIILENHIEKIKELSEGEDYIFSVADSADADGIATMRLKGIKIKAAKKIGIEKQIDAVRTKLQQGKLKILRNSLVRPDAKLVKSHKPVKLEDEFLRYEYMPAKEGQLQELPRDENNHALDCLSYGIVSLAVSDTGPVTVALKDIPPDISNNKQDNKNIFDPSNKLSVFNDALFREI